VSVRVRAAAMTLAHVPELVPYGSKPRRMLAGVGAAETAQRLEAAGRSYAQAVAYPPSRVFVGAAAPDVLWDAPRPAWRAEPNGAGARGSFGEILAQDDFYGLLQAVDRFSLVTLEHGFAERARRSLAAHPLLAAHAPALRPAPLSEVESAVGEGALPLRSGGALVGALRGDHAQDEALSAHVLLENLACKATAVLALRQLLDQAGVEAEAVEYAIGCGEEAIGDRYQRGGGGLAKAVCEEVGALRAGGSDTKAFCCAPVHALVLAGALIEAGVYRTVAVVAGGALGKLGMKAQQALDKDVPILEDVLAGMAVLLERGAADEPGPRLRLDCVGRFRVDGGSSQQALYEQLCVAPLEAVGLRLLDVDRYAVELHDPEITAPAGGGDVPRRNYRLLGGLGVLRGELAREELAGFERAHGLPGFAPTQGHIASAVPFLPHALGEMAAGRLGTTMLVAKGSLFLGRLTQLWDGMSVLVDDGGR
jgi:betaine reductase